MSVPASLAVAAAGWLLPGLGHVVLRRFAKACYFGALVLAVFGLGMLIGEGASVSSARSPFHVWGQYGAGVVSLLADRLLGSQPLGRTILRLEIGTVFTTVAGILNVVVMVDAYEIARGRPRPPRETER